MIVRLLQPARAQQQSQTVTGHLATNELAKRSFLAKAVDKRTRNNLYMRLDLVGGELDQVESMCVRVDENDVGANSPRGELATGRNRQLPKSQPRRTWAKAGTWNSVKVRKCLSVGKCSNS